MLEDILDPIIDNLFKGLNGDGKLMVLTQLENIILKRKCSLFEEILEHQHISKD